LLPSSFLGAQFELDFPESPPLMAT
jgi:hypothetical protein